MPGAVEDAGGCPRGHWGMLLACLFEGGAEGKGWRFGAGDEGEGRRFHANKAWWGFFVVVDAGDGGGRGFIRLVDRSISRHCLSMAGAVGVFAGEGGGEGMFVGNVVAEHRVQAVGFMVWEAMQNEDSELVGRVRVRAKQASKVDVRNGGPLSFGAELGLSAVTQLGD